MTLPKAFNRPADFIIGGAERPYLFRWFVIPRNRWFNIYLHKIVRSDDDRALHDHPWVNCSIVLKGGYIEVTDRKGIWRGPGSVVFRTAKARHRLALHFAVPVCWTLFITGPRIREWGFQCPQGWVHWKDFTGGANGEIVGRGCGED
jgi:hypothetical protein